MLLLLLFGGAGAVYAYDSSRDDVIAKGVRVAGVDVGGMHADQARRRLHAVLGARLRQPVVVRYGGRRFTLSARRAHVGMAIDTMVADAVARSRDGSIITRTVRGLRGSPIHVDLPGEVTYSRPAVARFARSIAHEVDREAQDATVQFSSSAPQPSPGHFGRRLDQPSLVAAVGHQLGSTARSGVIRAPVDRVSPKVTTADLAKKYPTVVTVDRAAFTLRLFKDLKLVRSYPIAVGQQGLETPAGLYHIQNKTVDPAWQVPNSAWTGSMAGKLVPGGTPENPLKARWLGIYDGAGIHGIDPSEYGTIGHAASHGCVRMRIPDVEALYDQVPVGTPIYIS